MEYEKGLGGAITADDYMRQQSVQKAQQLAQVGPEEAARRKTTRMRQTLLLLQSQIIQLLQEIES